jgi:hypothetical protein
VRTTWMAGAVLVVLGGIVFTATHLNLERFDAELRFRGQAHHDLTALLDDPKIKAGLRCGPLTGPNHKIIPDSRWISGLGEGRVLAREWATRIETSPKASTVDRRRAQLARRGGVAIVVTSRFGIFKQAWSDVNDDPLDQLPPRGFTRVKTTRFYAAYVRC